MSAQGSAGKPCFGPCALLSIPATVDGGHQMTKGRIEAFSDGVLAIIITIMVLELKVPHGHDLDALLPLWPVFLSYVLSFLYVGIYWNNHHHMFQAVRNIGGWVLWANLHLLFWLSLLPFTTGFMGENNFAAEPMAIYAFNLLMCGLAYMLLVFALIGQHGHDSTFARALGTDVKGKVSVALYILSIIASAVFGLPMLGFALLTIVAVMWVVPDRRFVAQKGEEPPQAR